MLIIQAEIISSTVIDIVKDVIQCQAGLCFAGLQWNRNIGDRIAYGEQIYRGLGAVLSSADDNPVITMGISRVRTSSHTPDRSR